eukprot:gene19687-biopygen13951
MNMINNTQTDDIGWGTTSKRSASDIEENVPKYLKKRKLNANPEKTEKYAVRKNGDESWKNTKYLGSHFDTKKDIKRRTGIAYGTFNDIKRWLTSPRASLSNKIRRFEAFLSTIFLYNSEIWTLTAKLENKIDVLQRVFLRKCLGITRADRVSNTDLYNRTKTTPWSITIKQRRLRFLGHILRLPKSTPLRKALTEYHHPVQRDPGRPHMTWWLLTQKDLKSLQTPIQKPKLPNLTTLASDRVKLRNITKL